MSSATTVHYCVGDVIQVFDTYAGGTDDGLACHMEIGIIAEQLKKDQYLVALPITGMEVVHVDWLRVPNLFFVKADILNNSDL